MLDEPPLCSLGRLTGGVCLPISTWKRFGESQRGNLLWCSGRYLLTGSLKRRHAVHKSGAGDVGGVARSARPLIGYERAGNRRYPVPSPPSQSLLCTLAALRSRYPPTV
ncbi:unnamed protein product, partial [Iphiclides podalirius]